MVVLHPDSPLRCVECGNKQLTVTFSRNPQSSTFEQWFVLCSRKTEHEDGKVWFGVWKKDQPPRDYPVQPSDYTPSTTRQVPAPKAPSSRLPCKSPFCNKISSITCPRQFCASDCRRAPGGPCTTHTVKLGKQKSTVPKTHPSAGRLSQRRTGSMWPYAASLSSDDEGLALAIKASLQPSTPHQSARLSIASPSHPPLPSSPVGHAGALSSSTQPPSPQPLSTIAATKPRISSQMGPAWQAKLQASSKAAVEKEERAARQAKLQQALKENLNILFFDKNDEPGRQLALQGSADMPDFPWVRPDEFIHRFGSGITAIDHRTTIGRWVELGRLNIVYKVSNNDTLVFRRRGVHRMPGIDNEVEHIRHPPPPAHFFKSMSSQRTEVRKEKKVREESRASMGPSHVSALPSRARHTPFLYTPTFNHNDSSSEVETSEITDRRECIKRTHDSNRSRGDGSLCKPVESSLDVGSSSRSPSPMMVDSWAASVPELAPSTPAEVPSFARFGLPLSPPLWFPDSSTSPSPQQSHSRPLSSPPSSLGRHSTPSLSSQSSSRCQPTSRPKKDLPWHSGLYCVDVVDGFERMNSRSLKGLSKAERFASVFPGRRYAETTVRDAQNQWTRASNSTKTAVLAAGRTTQGLWRAFSAQNPIKKPKC